MRKAILIFALAGMSVFAGYGRRDTPFITDGDTQFIGMNSKLDPASLEPGLVSYAQNMRFLNGSAATRLGFSRPDWANATDYGQIVGFGVYSDPDGVESLLIATPHMVYLVNETTTTALTVPVGVTLVWPVEFVQAFDKVLLLRKLAIPEVWDGVSAGFVLVTKSDPLDLTTDRIPTGITYGAMFENRFLFPISRDTMGMSDVLDYTSYDPILSVFRLNTGKSDRLQAIVPYPHGSVICFMDNSIVQLSNFAVDPTQTQLDVLNSNLGIAARRTACMVGSDIIFLSKPGGVYRLSEAIQGRIATTPVPISDEIQPVIDQINWDKVNAPITGATAILHGRYYYLAVPLKPSRDNKQILVYDTVTGQWQGIDQTPGVIVHAFASRVTAGARRLFMADFTSSIFLMEDDINGIDHTLAGDKPITSALTTRGYARAGTETNSNQNFRRVQALVSAANADTAAYIMTPDYNDSVLIGRVSRNRVKYYTWDKADYDPTNANNDFGVPLRQDYYASPSEVTSLGVPAGVKQTWLERWPARATGKWAAIKLVTSQGICELKNLAIESIPIVLGRGEYPSSVPPAPPPPVTTEDWAGQDFETYTAGNVSALGSASAYGGDCTLGPGYFSTDLANWGADDFETYTAGNISSLTLSINSGDSNLGTASFVTDQFNWATEDFEAYAAGNISSLTLSSGSGDSSLSTGSFVAQVQNYGADDLESYAIGNISSLTGHVDVGDTSLSNGSFV